jgi:monofunctional biosynthetic peptidoglycan transglycosylase
VTSDAPSPPLHRRLRAVWPALRRWLLRGIAFALLAPIAISLSFNVLQPPTTAVMLRRTVQRALDGKRPWYPRRDIVARAAIAPSLRRAVLAAEDDRFYLHWGLDLVEIGKAIDRAERGGRLRGASTITQQVAKNIFLWEGRSFVRKGLEAYLTLVLELTLPKDRILDLYLNLAEWGDGTFGAEMAARRHFGVSAARLTREQSARLAAILPSPRRWSPQGEVASRRAAIILDRMRYAAPRD